MATEKELELIKEITELAIQVTLSDSGVNIHASYIGHINVFEVRILRNNSLTVISNTDDGWTHLSGKDELWTERESIVSLAANLELIKGYARKVDADGVPV